MLLRRLKPLLALALVGVVADAKLGPWRPLCPEGKVVIQTQPIVIVDGSSTLYETFTTTFMIPHDAAYTSITIHGDRNATIFNIPPTGFRGTSPVVTVIIMTTIPTGAQIDPSASERDGITLPPVYPGGSSIAAIGRPENESSHGDRTQDLATQLLQSLDPQATLRVPGANDPHSSSLMMMTSSPPGDASSIISNGSPETENLISSRATGKAFSSQPRITATRRLNTDINTSLTASTVIAQLSSELTDSQRTWSNTHTTWRTHITFVTATSTAAVSKTRTYKVIPSGTDGVGTVVVEVSKTTTHANPTPAQSGESGIVFIALSAIIGSDSLTTISTRSPTAVKTGTGTDNTAIVDTDTPSQNTRTDSVSSEQFVLPVSFLAPKNHFPLVSAWAPISPLSIPQTAMDTDSTTISSDRIETSTKASLPSSLSSKSSALSSPSLSLNTTASIEGSKSTIISTKASTLASQGGSLSFDLSTISSSSPSSKTTGITEGDPSTQDATNTDGSNAISTDSRTQTSETKSVPASSGSFQYASISSSTSGSISTLYATVTISDTNRTTIISIQTYMQASESTTVSLMSFFSDTSLLSITSVSATGSTSPLHSTEPVTDSDSGISTSTETSSESSISSSSPIEVSISVNSSTTSASPIGSLVTEATNTDTQGTTVYTTDTPLELGPSGSVIVQQLAQSVPGTTNTVSATDNTTEVSWQTSSESGAMGTLSTTTVTLSFYSTSGILDSSASSSAYYVSTSDTTITLSSHTSSSFLTSANSDISTRITDYASTSDAAIMVSTRTSGSSISGVVANQRLVQSSPYTQSTTPGPDSTTAVSTKNSPEALVR
ncbi:hypothetical protein FBULB1_874 [Fusarium bulbicola]|nr:hypothetical protein FBULB1_874 [Fusarium bulbicola]